MIMDDIPEELWSFPPSSHSFQNSDIYSSALKMKIPSNTSELDFQRFLQEFGIDPEIHNSKSPSSIVDTQKIIQCNSSSSIEKNGANNKEISINPSDGANHKETPINPDDGASYKEMSINPNDGANYKETPINPDDGDKEISINPSIGANYKERSINPNDGVIHKEISINPNGGDNDEEVSINPNDGANDEEIFINPREYQTYLKHRLDFACAKIKASIPRNSQSPQESTSANLNNSSNVQENNEELEGVEDEMTQNMRSPYYEDAKKMRRLLQNRESARRSRKKKQVQESEIEKQVSELKVEQESKTKFAIELSHKFSEEMVNNRVLEAKIETLKAKVKMAEETLRRVNPSSFYAIMEKQNTNCFPSLGCNNNPNFSTSSSMDPSFVLVQHDPRQPYFLPSSNSYHSSHGRYEKK